MTVSTLTLIILLIIGASLASLFLCIINDPSKVFSLKGRSQCDHCKKILGIFNLIPIISYLYQKGQCSYCRKNLNINYLISEIFMALCLPLIWWISSHQSVEIQIILSLIIICICYIILLDWQKMLISMPVVVLLLILSVVLWGIEDNFSKSILLLKFLGLFFGFFSLWTINKIYTFIRKREGIGEGDPILFGALGFFLNIEFLFFILTISALCGAIYGIILIKYKKGSLSDPIPFGSFLGLGAITIFCIKTLYL